MFPHSITIFNIVNEEYRRQFVEDVFYYFDKAVSSEGRGESCNLTYHVIFSDTALKKYLTLEEYKKQKDYEAYYTLNLNDIIVLGECDDIETLSDLQKSNKEYFLIKDIADNRYGSSDLQNIEVTS